MGKARKSYEASDVAAMVERMLRALERRASTGDTEALVELAKLERGMSDHVGRAGAALHQFGYTYGELAGELGVSRQAARARFAGHDERGMSARHASRAADKSVA